MEPLLKAFIELFNFFSIAIDIVKAMYNVWMEYKAKAKETYHELTAVA